MRLQAEPPITTGAARRVSQRCAPRQPSALDVLASGPVASRPSLRLFEDPNNAIEVYQSARTNSRKSRMSSHCSFGKLRHSSRKPSVEVEMNVYSAVPTEETPGESDFIGFDSSDDFPADLTWREAGARILVSIQFQVLTAVLILGNAVVIGLETDVKQFKHWDMLEAFFLLCFFLEFLLKLCILGFCEYFNTSSADFNWNCFDCAIVSLGVVDFGMSTLVHSSSGRMATIFRMIRLLRILRVIRIVKFLKQLYLLAFGLAEAAQAVLWVTVLMSFVLYVCSIIMVKTVGNPDARDPNYEFLVDHYGGVLKAMFSLFVLMSSPNLPVYQEQVGLLESRPLFVCFLVGFIIFGSFGMIALLTGVISESMFEKNILRKEEERAEYDKMRGQFGDVCEELFRPLAGHDVSEVPASSLLNIVPKIVSTFEFYGVFLTKFDIETMLQYMDVDESGSLSLQEFSRGMLLLAEGLRPISIQEVHHNIGVCRVKLERMESTLNDLAAEKGNVASFMEGSVKPEESSEVDVADLIGNLEQLLKRHDEGLQDLRRQTCSISEMQTQLLHQREEKLVTNLTTSLAKLDANAQSCKLETQEKYSDCGHINSRSDSRTSLPPPKVCSGPEASNVVNSSLQGGLGMVGHVEELMIWRCDMETEIKRLGELTRQAASVSVSTALQANEPTTSISDKDGLQWQCDMETEIKRLGELTRQAASVSVSSALQANEPTTSISDKDGLQYARMGKHIVCDSEARKPAGFMDALHIVLDSETKH